MKKSCITTVVIAAIAALSAGCDSDTSARVDDGIDRAFQVPGQVAGAAGEAGGNLASTAVKTPGNAVRGTGDRINDDEQ